jgi:hypothetical protein
MNLLEIISKFPDEIASTGILVCKEILKVLFVND